MSICNKDCFHCPHPDCINDSFDAQDAKQTAQIDKLLGVQSKHAASNREYYLRNRERIIAKTRKWYAEHKDYAKIRRRETYLKNRETALAKQREYDKIRRHSGEKQKNSRTA